MLISITGCEKNEDIVPPETYPIDQTDYLADRGDIFSFYNADPIHYFGHHGIPALCRLSNLKKTIGGNYLNAFDGLKPYFYIEGLYGSFELSLINPEFVNHLLELNSSPDFNELVQTLIFFTDKLDATNPDDPFVQEIYNSFTIIVEFAFNPAMFADLAINPQKEYITPLPENTIDAIGYCGMDYFTELICQTKINNEDDNNTSDNVDWDNITGVPFKTTHNGACATLATGACAEKLGILDSDVNGKEWEDLSEEIGATPGEVGAPISGINKYFEENGYGVSSAYDGLFESAVDEAKDALDRGCDVMIQYVSADGKSSHIEVVTGISVDSDDDEKGTISTLSWGQSATVTYDSGEYSGKSDGSRYKQSGEDKSYLQGTGTAKLIYYCPED